MHKRTKNCKLKLGSRGKRNLGSSSPKSLNPYNARHVFFDSSRVQNFRLQSHRPLQSSQKTHTRQQSLLWSTASAATGIQSRQGLGFARKFSDSSIKNTILMHLQWISLNNMVFSSCHCKDLSILGSDPGAHLKCHVAAESLLSQLKIN